MDEIISYLKNKKNLINLLTLAIIVLALPLGIGALRQQQVFTSKAAAGSIEFLTKDKTGPSAPDGTSCVQTLNSKLVTKCQTVKIWVTAPATLTVKGPELVSKVYAQAVCSDDSDCGDLPQYCDGSVTRRCTGGYCDPSNGAATSDGCVRSCDIVSDNPLNCGGSADQCSSDCGDLPQYCDGSVTRRCTGGYCDPSNGAATSDGCVRSCDIVSDNPLNCGGSAPVGDFCAVLISSSKTPTGTINAGDNTRLGVYKKSEHSYGYRDYTMTIKKQDGSTLEPSLAYEAYYRITNAGTYTITANGHSCDFATLTVNSGGSGGGGGIGSTCSTSADCSDTKKMQCQDVNGVKKCRWLPGFGDPVCCTNNGQCLSGKVCESAPNNSSDRACTTTQTCVTGGSSPSPSPSSSPGTTGKIVSFKLSENPNSFTGQDYTYTQGGVVVDFAFANSKAEDKFVYAQFKDDKGEVSNLMQMALGKIYMLGGAPTINGSLACPYDIKNDVINITVPGSNFGSVKGTLTVNGQALSNDSYDDWKDNSVKVHIRNPQSSSTGTKLNVKLTKEDGQSDDSSCTINVNQFDVGAKWMCGIANIQDIPNSTLSIYDMANYQVIGIGNTNMSQNLGVGATVYSGTLKTKETVTISKDGTIKNVKTKLKEGSVYKVCIKPPMGIRKCSDTFTFSSGTIVTKFDMTIGNFNGDSCKNILDVADMRQNYGCGGTRKDDVNGDGCVNSFEAGCMFQRNFGECDESEPF